MQIVLIGNVTRFRRMCPLSPGFLAACAGLLLSAVCGYSFLLGLEKGRADTWPGQGAQFATDTRQSRLASRWHDALTRQHQFLGEMRADAERRLDTLAVRLGEVQARSLRLEALGERLASAAKIDDLNFSLSDAPGLGGVQPADWQRMTHDEDGLLASLDALYERLVDREDKLVALESLLLDADLRKARQPTGRPVTAGWLSSPFGWRPDPFTGQPAHHAGVDFSGQPGTSVVAVADGLVTWSGRRLNYGHTIDIYHGDGLSTRYAHNAKNLVAVGEKVKKGQVIALMGSTGRSTGPHLHFEVLQGGKAINPMKMLRSQH